jgi:Arc/MetJ-type ribon-helix-helix transcriptional regulator
MVSLNIAVTESAKAFIEGQVAAGRFRDTAEYIVALVEADRAREIRDEIEAQLVKSLRSPSELMPDGEWDEIRQVGEQILEDKRRR